MLKGAGDIWTEKSKLINGIKQQLMALIIIYGTKEKVIFWILFGLVIIVFR